VKPVVVCRSETWPMTEVDVKSLSIWEDRGTSGRIRNMENKNYSGIARIGQRFIHSRRH